VSKIKQSGVATPLASTTGADICADPSGYYVNYHSTEFPDGSIRGANSASTRIPNCERTLAPSAPPRPPRRELSSAKKSA